MVGAKGLFSGAFFGCFVAGAMGQFYTLKVGYLAAAPRPLLTCGNLPLFTGVLGGAGGAAALGATSKRKIRTPKAWKKASQLNGSPWLLGFLQLLKVWKSMIFPH